MSPKAARTVKIVAGILFLVLGVAGLFLPFLQGFLFIAIGLAILAPHWPWADRQLDRLRRRYPHLAQRFDDGRHRVEGWVRRVLRRRGGA